MSNAERLRVLRADAVERGLCFTCRCRAVRAGARYCDVCIQLGYVGLWWAYGPTPVLVAIGAAVLVLAGVARWVTRYPNNEE